MLRAFIVEFTIVFSILNFFNRSAYAEPGIEMIPIVVYQGREVSDYEQSALISLRQDLKDFPFIHAVNPVYAIDGGKTLIGFKKFLSGFIKPDDGIFMHAAPMHSWIKAAGLSATSLVGIYGRVANECSSLCGLDQSLDSFSSNDLETFLDFGRQKMKDSGFGFMKSIVFEQGLVSNPIWDAAESAGFTYECSGFNYEMAKAYLGRTPAYSAGAAVTKSLLADGGKRSSYKGRNLDFVRYGIYVDVAGEADLVNHIKAATAFAVSEGRTVQLPIFINAMSLMHNESKVATIIQEIRVQSSALKIPLIAWNNEGNSSWDMNEMKSIGVGDIKAMSLSENTSFEDRELQGNLSDFIPAEQSALPSHAKEMSH